MTDQNRQENLQEPIDRLYQALGAEDTATMRELLRAMHPSEIADIIEGLPGKARATVWVGLFLSKPL